MRCTHGAPAVIPLACATEQTSASRDATRGVHARSFLGAGDPRGRRLRAGLAAPPCDPRAAEAPRRRGAPPATVLRVLVPPPRPRAPGHLPRREPARLDEPRDRLPAGSRARRARGLVAHATVDGRVAVAAG